MHSWVRIRPIKVAGLSNEFVAHCIRDGVRRVFGDSR
jgi:hypothetical protein